MPLDTNPHTRLLQSLIRFVGEKQAQDTHDNNQERPKQTTRIRNHLFVIFRHVISKRRQHQSHKGQDDIQENKITGLIVHTFGLVKSILAPQQKKATSTPNNANLGSYVSRKNGTIIVPAATWPKLSRMFASRLTRSPVNSNVITATITYSLKFRPLNLFLILCFVLGIWALPSVASAATLYWVGGSDGASFNSASNWASSDHATIYA